MRNLHFQENIYLVTLMRCVHLFQDWARNHSGDPEIEAALKRGEDPGVALVSSTSTRHGYIIPLWLVRVIAYL